MLSGQPLMRGVRHVRTTDVAVRLADSDVPALLTEYDMVIWGAVRVPWKQVTVRIELGDQTFIFVGMASADDWEGSRRAFEFILASLRLESSKRPPPRPT